MCLVLCLAVPVPSRAQSLLPVAARMQGGAEANLLVLEVQLDGHVLSDNFAAYQEGSHILLPLGELSRLLTLAITVRAAEGTASGFVIREGHDFSLNINESTATVGGRSMSFEPRLATVIGDDIYVSSQLLSRWLPLGLAVDLSRLQLRVEPRERLPLQERLEREDSGSRLRGPGAAVGDPGYPHVTTAYGLIGVPFIDQTFGYQANLGNQPHDSKATYTGYFTGDLLGMEGAAYVATHRESQVVANGETTSASQVRVTLARHDPDAGLLGPLHARSVAVGSITVPSVPNVMIGSPTGNGVMLSNRPLDQPTSFDRQNLRGNLPPGWDVTLYYNDALLAYQQSRSDGQYAFDDLPLSFGPNEFRMVFNGPLGQVRIERQSFLLDHSIVAPGEALYSIIQQRADGTSSRSVASINGGSMRSVAQVDLGITRAISMNGTFVRKPDLVTGEELTYGQIGLRAYLDSMILSTQLTTSQEGGLLAEIDVKTRLFGYSVDLTHLQRQGAFRSDLLNSESDAIRFHDSVRLLGSYKPNGLAPVSLALDAQRDQLAAGGERVDVTGRVSTMVKGTSVSNTVNWQSAAGSSAAQGNLQLSRRVMDIGLNAQLGYTISPRASLQSVSLTADRALGDAYRINAGFQHTMSDPLTLLSLGLSKNLGRFGLALSSSYSSRHELALGVQLFIAMGQEPRTGDWLVDAQPLAGTGAVSARAFVDRNLNGVRDPGEELISNAGFIFNGGGRHPSRTDASGTDFIGRLPSGQYTDIALDPDTLEDPQWKPMTPGVRVLPRPGVVDILEFPVVATSEIDGTVYLLDNGKRREIGDARLELVDATGAVVMTARSSPDGYYLLHQVIPGRYSIRIAPDQVAKLGLGGVLDRPLTVPPDGDFINGQDLELQVAARP
jgi:hypothetical protein